MSRCEWLEIHNKTLGHCIVTIVYLETLSSFFSSKYCYGIRVDQLNLNNIKHEKYTNNKEWHYAKIWPTIFFRKCNIYGELSRPCSTTLSMWVGYTYMCVKKIQLYLKMWCSTSFDKTWYAEAAIYAKKFLFSHSIVS